ncbi:MAG: HD domain-containing protein, partial [Mogibacterium sp.]|nr:HD domain-containing protein [Mogibacterium sp.]
MNHNQDMITVNALAQAIRDAGGRIYYVGGCVRDALMGRELKDIDVEVHGINADELHEMLKNFGTPLCYGRSFGVFSLSGTGVDIALSRKERAIGKGHRDFEIEADPMLGTKEAARRRDFTINALMQDVLNGEIIDEFGGLEDLNAGIVRHIDKNHFAEDPLRVLRAARFAAVLGFKVDEETVGLCKGIDIKELSRERVEEETRKALLNSQKPSVYFETLREMNQLDYWFKELKDTIGVEQNPFYHPEGDVWVHTMEVVDRAAEFRDDSGNPYAFMLLALCHDLGKPATFEVIDGAIHFYGHETEGLPFVGEFLDRIVSEKAVKSYVKNMVPLHMKPNVISVSKPSLKSTNKMYDQAVMPKDLIYFAMSDEPVMSGMEVFHGDSDFLFERFDEYTKTMAKPHVTGEDLIEAGFEPGRHFSEALEYAHKLRLAG